MTGTPTRTRSRTSLATRISLLAVGIVVVTGIVAGVVAAGLIRSSGTSAARQTLGRLADLSQSIADGAPAGQARARRVLQELNVRSATVTPAGRLVAPAPLARRALTPTDVTRLLAGQDVSAERQVNGVTVLVEARPTDNGGGVVLVQRRADAVAQNEKALRRLILALVIAGAIALLLGLFVAWRLARPLRRTAAAAHALAQGRRDVELPVSGPTELAEVSAAINTLTGALAHSEQRQREFLLSISHDLRTPLTAIAGYAESLADGVVPPDETPRAAGVILAEAHRLDRLVGDLLDLARLDAQDLRVDLAQVDLVALARAAAVVWSTRCTAVGVRFVLEAGPEIDGVSPPPVVLSDAARIRQAIDGLFDNALRVTPPGAAIVLAVRAEGPLAVIEVRDGGPGLTDDDLGVAFEQGVLHERYRGVREVGTGLGLAIVHRLVARLGGTVEAGHAYEGGARFTVRLPAGQGVTSRP